MKKTSLDSLITWLRSYADRELSTTYREYEEGRKDGHTDMARGVLSALTKLKLELDTIPHL